MKLYCRCVGGEGVLRFLYCSWTVMQHLDSSQWMEVQYKAVAITSRKHVAKHFRVAKKYCAQWQLKGSRCLTHDLCTIFIGFTQRDNCAIAIVNIIKLKFQAALVSEFIVQTDHSFAT